MSINKLDSKGISEAYEILMLLDEETLEKISENILETFKEKRDLDYEINIEKLMDVEMLQENNKKQLNKIKLKSTKVLFLHILTLFTNTNFRRKL